MAALRVKNGVYLQSILYEVRAFMYYIEIECLRDSSHKDTKKPNTGHHYDHKSEFLETEGRFVRPE